MTVSARIRYHAHSSAALFHQSRADVKALCGPMGSGKSTAVVMEWLQMMRESDIPLRGCVMRESYRQLHDSTRKTYEEWLGPVSEYVKQDEVCRTTIPNHAGKVLTHEMFFRHARRADDASNFLSTEFAFIWLEEPVPAFQVEGGAVVGAGLPEGVFKIAVGRLRQKGAPRHHLILSFNPPSKFHWVYKQFFKKSSSELADASMALFRQPARENEKNLRAGYYKQMGAIMDPEMARRFIEGDCVTIYPGLPVFKAFREQTHFREELELLPNVPLVLMFDFGLTPVCVIAQIAESSQLRVLKEVQLFDASALELGDRVKDVLKSEFQGHKILRMWGDPAGAERSQADKATAFQILHDKLGAVVLPGAKYWRDRFEAVNQRATRIVDGEPAILVDSTRCPLLSEGLLGAYRYPKGVEDGNGNQLPLKNKFSHVCDALQYGCSGEFSAVTGEALREHTLENTPKIPAYDPFAPLRTGGSGTWMGR